MKSGRTLTSAAPPIEPISPSAEFSAVLARVARLEDRVAILEEQRKPHPPIDPRVLLSKLLPAVAGRFGSDPFTTRELFNDPVFRDLLAPLNAKRTGKLLRKSLGHTIDGLKSFALR